MSNKLGNIIKELNANVDNASNSEKAKKWRKKLISIGLPMAIIGIIGLIVAVILFITSSQNVLNSSDSMKIPNMVLPSVLFIISMFLCVIGFTIAYLGFQIVIVGVTSKVINDAVGDNCPKCGDIITEDEVYCSKCGTQLRLKCSKCGHINSVKYDYCENCGN